MITRHYDDGVDGDEEENDDEDDDDDSRYGDGFARPPSRARLGKMCRSCPSSAMQV